MSDDVRRRMDAMYRVQRHIYDLTRRFYLLGRDRLIRELDLRPGEVLCEVGCGTGRNLVHMARRYPDAVICGLDASEEMLKSARAALARHGLTERVRLVQGYAERFDPATDFGLEAPVDRVVFSYSLSMIPPWRAAIDRALETVRPGGTVHIVDFGDQAGLPRWFRSVLYTWLSWFGVHFRPEMLAHVRSIEGGPADRVSVTPVARGYAYLATIRRAPALDARATGT